jgi:hypothetical protein
MDLSATPFVIDPAALPVEETFSERVKIGGAEFSMAGFVARHGDRVVTGSAAGTDDSQAPRAYMELLERLATLDAEARAVERWEARSIAGAVVGTVDSSALFVPDEQPEARRRSKSNGVAAHSNWAWACERALQELIERDRVLRAWSGTLGGVALEPAHLRFEWSTVAEHYAVRLVRFGPDDGHAVVGCFAFPRHAEAPMSYGFTCRSNEQDAASSAEQECLQRLSFLWGESIPVRPPMPTPTPDYHQEYYLSPVGIEALGAWLDALPAVGETAMPAPDVCFVDVTPPDWRGRLVVVKAHAPSLATLCFGVDPVLGVHPIA